MIVTSLQSAPIQTILVHKLTNILSNKLQTHVEIRSVNFAFFNNVILNGVYIEDLNKDTLLYAGNVKASIRRFPLFGRNLSLGRIQLSDGEFNLRIDTAATNIQRVVWKISPPDRIKDTTSNKPVFPIMDAHSVELNNFAFSMYRDEQDSIVRSPHSMNFRDLFVDSIYLRANKIHVKNDTLFFNAEKLCLKEKSGYRIHSLTADCYIVPGKDVRLNNAEIIDDFSHVKMDYFSMTYNEGDDFKDFVNKVTLTGDFKDSQVSFKSIGYFAAALQNLDITANINGLVTGPVANLKSNNLYIKGFNNTILSGRFSMTGLPEINETIIYADLKQLRTQPRDFFTAMHEITGDEMYSLEKFLSNVEQVDFKGSFTGLYNDFVANGMLTSNLGTLNLDVLFKTDLRSKGIEFSGKVSTPQFDAGTLLKTNLIGHTSFNLMTKGQVPKNGNPNLFGEGVISELMFYDYKYENIKLSGTVRENEFSGEVYVQDDNIDLSFLGKINYKGTTDDPVPLFDFNADLRHINLAKLNFNKRDSVSILQGKISANFKGSNITNYEGDIKFTNGIYTDLYEKINIGDVSLASTEENGKNKLQLKSDFIDIEYIGQYLFGQFVKELQHIAYIYAPALELSNTDSLSLQHKQTQRYEIHARTKGQKNIARIIRPGLYIADNTNLNLIVDTAHKVLLDFNSKNITLNNNIFNDVKIDAQNTKDSLSLKINSSNITTGGLSFQNVSADNSIINNIITTQVKYNNISDRKNNGNLYLRSRIFKTEPENKLGLDVNLQQSSLILNDSIWWFAPSNITVQSDKIDVNNFKFYRTNQQYFTIDGILSANQTDTIILHLSDYNLKAVNAITQNAGYTIGGNVSGTAEIMSVYKTPLAMINVNANDITINNDTLGNITIASFWDNVYKRLNITTRIYNNNEINANINGFISPADSKLQIDMIMYKLRFGHIEPLLTNIVSDIQGNVSGMLSLRGNFNDPVLSGSVDLNQTSLLIDYLQTKYRLDAKINVEKNKITVQNGTLYDINNNTGNLDVTVNHNKFKNIYFDATATINNMMCLNTTEYDNPLFYGTSYATGGIRMYGTAKDIHFNITAQADRNSRLYIPLSSTAEAKDISMLTFKKPDIQDSTVIQENEPIIRPKTNIDLSLDLSITPESEVQIIIDKKAGDILRAQGQGNLKINVNPAIDLFTIVGDYQVSQGTYNFSLPAFNFITRKFNINEGSLIKFDGDVEGATLNAQATYRTRPVSLSPLMLYSTTNDPTSKSKRYTVECLISITGKMSHPNLKFGIDVQNLDPETRSIVMSALNTEEKVTTQFLALLVMNSFIPEQQYGNINYGTTTVLSNATDLVSGQIGNLIGLLNLPVPLDIGVDVGMDDNQQISDFEVNANVVLFDRVILNGSFGNNTRQADRQLVGDFELDVLLGKLGKYRFKVFTRSSDYFTNDLEYNMQGVGFSYQTEFNNFKELFRRRKKVKEGKDSEDVTKKAAGENNPEANEQTNN